MSLLGRLLSGAAGSTSATLKLPLESTVDTQFSYRLLFPELEALCHNEQVFPLSSGTILPSAGINFDLDAELDMDMRDVRMIIMQESTTPHPAPLYDSHAPPPPPITSPPSDRQSPGSGPAHSGREARRSISSPRKGSLGHISKPVVIQQEPVAVGTRTFGSAFGRPAQNKAEGYKEETDGQRSQREYREDLSTFSNCIFGSSDVLAYKGTGTKVHILPSETKNNHNFAPGSYVGEGSLGRSSMKSSRLAQSFTSENLAGPTSAGFTSPTISSRGSERKRVLITRMFPVTLPNDDPDEVIQDRTPTGQAAANQNSGYPFPQVSHGSIHGERKKLQPKQKRTPMYAVGLVITLLPTPYAPVQTSRSSFQAPSSYTEQESMPSSFNSTRRAGWTMLGHGFGVESLDSSYSSEVDDRIDIITRHWDIIMRTLSHLQAASSTVLLAMLKQADISSPDPRRESFSHHRAASASVSISGKRVAEDIKTFKPPKTNAKFVQLVHNCLMGNQMIQNEVDASRQRILSGLKATQVVTGQGRWGIWREEARLVNKWAGGKDEGFFFFNLLTGFLGNHTEWLQALGPSWYRRRRYQQQRANKDDDVSLPARTVIISDNKVMARRLIFLLSAFLPANQTLSSPRVHRPSTSTSFGGYSQSPPGLYTVPIMREESLRRKINKRSSTSGIKTAHSRTMSFPAQTSYGRMPLDIHHHDRRPSDATSIKTANLPIPGSDVGTRKSSAATIGTASPVTTMSHFSSTRRPVRGTGPIARPGSSGSLAADDLMRSLKRDSSSHVSIDSQNQNSRWGSMISGFWSNKRRDSSASTSIEPFSVDGLEITESPYTTSTSKKGKLSQMVDEANLLPHQKTLQQRERETRRSDGSNTTARPEEDQNEEDETEDEKDEDSPQTLRSKERIHDPSGAYQSPVKTSINERDGVIDIDVPLPDYLAFETAVSSPSSSGYLSTPGFGNGMEGFEHYSRAGSDSETALNVGGWLPRFHPDFAVHAIPSSSSANIVEEIKESMRAEPTPILSYTPHSNEDRWVDISSAVIADTTNFSIKHILYRRLIRVKSPTAETTPSLPNSFDSRYGNVYHPSTLTPGATSHDGYIDEKFIEEPIISLDETLVDAVERIIAQSGDVSRNSSVCSSTATSRRGSNVNIDVPTSAPIGTTRLVNAKMPQTHLEVPRNECKRIVLSALEEIVREVVEGRRDGGVAGGGESVDGARERGLERGESFLREGVRVWLEGVEGGN